MGIAIYGTPNFFGERFKLKPSIRETAICNFLGRGIKYHHFIWLTYLEQIMYWTRWFTDRDRDQP